MEDNGTDKVKHNVKSAFERKSAAVYALCLHYSALALQYFRAEQSNNRFWNNQTNIAKDTVFSSAFKDSGDIIGWFMAHSVQYGVYLEKANNEKNAALGPVINEFYQRFLVDLRKLYAD